MATLVKNIPVYLNENWSTGSRKYLAVLINSSTYAVTLKAYDDTSGLWDIQGADEIVSSLLVSGLYHKNARNPVVQEGGRIRLLPGNVVKPDGTNLAQGLWIGYIDRDFFDGLYVAGVDYTAGFFGISTNADVPDLTLTGPYLTLGGGRLATDEYWYKFSYVYDGVQESLLSSGTRINNQSDDQTWYWSFDITYASHNKRITAINVYRSTSENGTYTLIETVNLLRDADKFLTGTGTAYDGRGHLYIPGLSTYDFAGDLVSNYAVTISGSDYDIETPTNGQVVFQTKAGEPAITDLTWDGAWILKQSGGASLASASSGAYCGINTIILNDNDLVPGKYVGGIMKVGTNYKYIELNVEKALQYDGAGTSFSYPSTGYNWTLMNPVDGLYYSVDGTTKVTYTVFDPGITGTTEFGLAGEVSIQTHGEFARIISGRLWQLNVILDPQDKAETQNLAVVYSEVDQYDINPVSNLILLPGEKGTPTGIAELLDSPVFMQERGLTILRIGTNIDDPSKWVSDESIHGIGNVAKEGFISVFGSLYVSAWDGIYRLSPNNLAEYDRTPTLQLRISEPINDVYLALSTAQKQAIKATFHQPTNEILFLLGSDVWAYSIVFNQWRQIESARTVSLMGVDEAGNALIYDATTEKLYSPSVSEAVGCRYVSKTFVLDTNRKMPVPPITITYKSATALTLNFYFDGSGSASITKTIPLSTSITSITYNIRERASRFKLEIVDTATSTTATEIHRITLGGA